jgi:hypothetical protein
METIVNKVAESGIITLDLAPFIPNSEEVALFDLKPFLFREMILREKDYRAALLTYDWEQYRGKHVAVMCSADAVIPVWAYMLAASYMEPLAASVLYGTVDELAKLLAIQRIKAIDISEYMDKRVVIKGCGDTVIPEAAYVAVTERLRPVVKSLMYGEPCSTVPIYKKPQKG